MPIFHYGGGGKQVNNSKLFFDSDICFFLQFMFFYFRCYRGNVLVPDTVRCYGVFVLGTAS